MKWDNIWYDKIRKVKKLKNKILFISNHASFFCSHRLNIFTESNRRKIQFKLIFGSPASKSMEIFAIKKLKKLKVNYIKLDYSHNSINIFKDFKSIMQIKEIIKDYKPNIIHSASPKANLLSAIISRIFKVDKIVLSLSGLGYLFTNKKKNYFNLLKASIFLKILQFCLKNQKKKIIVQNKDDYKFIKLNLNLKKNEIYLIKGGSGINLENYKNFKRKHTKNICMISRVVANKGVKEYLRAAKIVKNKFPKWKFILVGSEDYKSPDNINRFFLNYFKEKKIVKFVRFNENIINILKKTEIFCLPSYREGMPKVTLEALCAGIPVVTTDVVGCRDSIINKYNGILCKPFNHKDLAKKIELLILNKYLRKKLSNNARKYAKKNFSINNVTNSIFKIYNLK